MKHEIYSTNRKLLLSLAITAGAVFLITIGVWIRSALVSGAEDNARMYRTAVQTTSDRELNHSIDTKQRYVLAPVTISAVDLVKFPEMNKEFSAVEKTEETYTRHTRQDCTTDADGNTSCTTETYYTWDYTDEWDVKANEVTMAERKYSISLFNLRYRSVKAKDIINGAEGQYTYDRTDGGFWGRDWFSSDTEGDKRYSYDVLELPQSGTAFFNLTDGVNSGNGGPISLDSKSPEDIVKDAQKSASIRSLVFNIFWSILVIGAVGLGIYAVWFSEY